MPVGVHTNQITHFSARIRPLRVTRNLRTFLPYDHLHGIQTWNYRGDLHLQQESAIWPIRCTISPCRQPGSKVTMRFWWSTTTRPMLRNEVFYGSGRMYGAVREDSQGFVVCPKTGRSEKPGLPTPSFIDDDVDSSPQIFCGPGRRFLTDHPNVFALPEPPIYVHFDDGKPSWVSHMKISSLAQMPGTAQGPGPRGYQYPAGS